MDVEWLVSRSNCVFSIGMLNRLLMRIREGYERGAWKAQGEKGLTRDGSPSSLTGGRVGKQTLQRRQILVREMSTTT